MSEPATRGAASAPPLATPPPSLSEPPPQHTFRLSGHQEGRMTSAVSPQVPDDLLVRTQAPDDLLVSPQAPDDLLVRGAR